MADVETPKTIFIQSSQLRPSGPEEFIASCLSESPTGLILPDQPNRAVRTRTLRGVGGGSREAPPYPDILLFLCVFAFTAK